MKKKNIEKTERTPFTLRQATAEDLHFLFRVSTEAMRPVNKAINPGKIVDLEKELEIYTAKFDPEEIEVIQYQDQDVGRLRVVRLAESIYVGGIQILPEYQGKGIGTGIFTDLIQESKKSNNPILLEVHNVNSHALSFYIKLGFEKSGKTDTQTILQFWHYQCL